MTRAQPRPSRRPLTPPTAADVAEMIDRASRADVSESSPPFGHRARLLPPPPAQIPQKRTAVPPPDFSTQTYGLNWVLYWARYFSSQNLPEPPPDPTTYRRGLIWA